MLVAQAGRGLDRAELDALRSARRAEERAELREMLRRQRLERRELRGDDAHQRVDALQAPERLAGFARVERGTRPSMSCKIALNHSSLA